MNSKIFNIKSIILSILIVSLVACEGRRDFPGLVETGVALDNNDILLIPGRTQDVMPRFIPDINPKRSYSWEIDNPNVAELKMNDDYSVSISAKEGGETILRIISQDGSNLVAEAKLKVLASAPVDITNKGFLIVTRENSGGRDGKEGSLKLVDGNIDTKFVSNFANPFYMILQFQQPRVVNFYSLTSANDASDRDPRDWKIQGSNDGVNWEVLDQRNNETFDARKMTREFYFKNDKGFVAYLFSVDNNNGGGLFQLSEWNLLSIEE